MSEKRNDGGPAFPSEQTAWRPDKVFREGELVPHSGMSLRDWFAGQALMLAGAYAITMTLGGKAPPMNEDDLTRRAYQTANAMLKAREQ